MLLVNEQPMPFQERMTLADVARLVDPQADIFIVNSCPVAPDTVLRDEDRCWVWRRGRSVSSEEMRRLLFARHTPGVQSRLQESHVGIMGLGGLGSLVAIALARMGVGRLRLVDFDVVEPTNLNRQQYFIDQIGLAKTEALCATLARVNPHVVVEAVNQRLTEETIASAFADVHALVECFDDPAMKAAGLRAALRHLPGVFYVGSSGVAGHADNNAIRTRRLFPGVYVVGDGDLAAEPGRGLMAARVGIAAHQQANQVVRLLLGEDVETKQP